MPFWNLRRLYAVTLLLFLLLVLWDASGLDLPLARLFGGAQGFAWRDHHTFALLTHEGPRYASGALLAALAVGVWRPWGFLRVMAPAQRAQLVLSVIGAMLAVSVFKRLNTTSCPWDLAEFGGVAQYISHWVWGVRDLGPGHCFPAGHASAAFGFVAGWFVLRRAAPNVARLWLPGALMAGLALGWAQQMRGAHFMSHTLWSAWSCWTVGLALESLAQLHVRLGVAADTKLNEA
ncbi:MAG: phosphatase PAP2 family protein [Diaphorobacter nitroreducens]|uniref:phosphatase PAP2 family protein n=1 Tax=Diaphorobacter nitroreducens TaxID=164759 RepID=UPI003C758D23